MGAGTFYGIAVALTMALSWLSRDHVQQKLGLLLLADWAASNIAVNMLGFYHAPLLVPSINAAIAIFVAILGYKNRNNSALVVFVLYGIIGATHVAAFLLHREGTYPYYLTLNLLFLAQLLIVGGSSAWMAVRAWASGGHQWSRIDHPGGSRMGGAT